MKYSCDVSERGGLAADCSLSNAERSLVYLQNQSGVVFILKERHNTAVKGRCHKQRNIKKKSDIYQLLSVWVEHEVNPDVLNLLEHNQTNIVSVSVV